MLGQQQTGSSTAGLLTATIIFIALLVYADQFAFNDNHQGWIATLLNPVAGPAPESGFSVTPATDTDTIPQLAQGVFETSTIADESEKNIPVTTEEVASRPEIISRVVDEKSAARPLQAPATQDAVFAQEAYPAAYNTGDRASVSAYHGNFAGINGNQYYIADSRANGQGRGRGTLKSDGEFNFSMSFKSRARMDADTDLNADSTVYGNAYQQQLYHQNTAAYPGYGYNYYRY